MQRNATTEKESIKHHNTKKVLVNLSETLLPFQIMWQTAPSQTQSTMQP